MTGTFFCPFCCSSQQKQEYVEDGVRKLRCASCGCPAESGPVETREPIFDRPKVLCIDDDRLLLGLFRDTLESNGFEALTASDGPRIRRFLPASRMDSSVDRFRITGIPDPVSSHFSRYPVEFQPRVTFENPRRPQSARQQRPAELSRVSWLP